MFIKPDYNLKNIYEIDLDDLKNQGINALLFDLDSTIMGSKTGCYTKETLEWLEKVNIYIIICIKSCKKVYAGT